MTRIALQEWLGRNGVAAAQRLREAVEHERREIELVEQQIGKFDSTVNWNQEAKRLAAENDRLDRELAELESQVSLVYERLIEETEALIRQVETADAPAIIHDAQALFDVYSPHELRQPIESSSIALLSADLGVCDLPARLQSNAVEQFASCAAILRDAGGSVRELAEMERIRGALSAEIHQAEAKLAEHGVAGEIQRHLYEIRDSAWFTEDVLAPNISAAESEAEWNLPYDILTKVQNAH